AFIAAGYLGGEIAITVVVGGWAFGERLHVVAGHARPYRRAVQAGDDLEAMLAAAFHDAVILSPGIHYRPRAALVYEIALAAYLNVVPREGLAHPLETGS